MPFAQKIILICLVLVGCHKPPAYAPSAMPEASKGPAPMGSATSNALLKEKVELLSLMMQGKIPTEQLQQAVEKAQALLKAPTQVLDGEAQKAIMVHDLYRRLPAGISEQTPLADTNKQKLILAKLYFDERRFIEAAHQLSSLLDEAPNYPDARNLLARCFFFLGNQDRTIAELNFVLNTGNPPKTEKLDALFLLGAAVLESQTPSKENLSQGIDAWETYLKEAPQSPQKTTVEKGLAAMRNAMNTPDGVNPNSRLAQLGEGASDTEKNRAKALDAFEQKSPQAALPILRQALTNLKPEPEILTALGRTLVRLQKVPEAQEAFAKAVELFPNHVPAWHYQGMAFLLGGSPEKAVQSWKTVVSKDPAYAQTHQLSRRIQVAERMSSQQSP